LSVSALHAGTLKAGIVPERGAELGTTGTGTAVCLTVRDDGPGIAVEQQGLLFREFSRIEPESAYAPFRASIFPTPAAGGNRSPGLPVRPVTTAEEDMSLTPETIAQPQ
jgi:hypothetical protein